MINYGKCAKNGSGNSVYAIFLAFLQIAVSFPFPPNFRYTWFLPRFSLPVGLDDLTLNGCRYPLEYIRVRTPLDLRDGIVVLGAQIDEVGSELESVSEFDMLV